MNGQTNENQPMRPDFSDSPSVNGSTPLNPGGNGFDNQPIPSGWSPNINPVLTPDIGTTSSPVPIETPVSPMSGSSPPAPMSSIPNIPDNIAPIPSSINSAPSTDPIPAPIIEAAPIPVITPISTPAPVIAPTPAPVPLNSESIGFNNQPVPLSWSPSAIPTPGPIETPVSPMSGSSPSAPISSIPGANGNPISTPVAPINPVSSVNPVPTFGAGTPSVASRPIISPSVEPVTISASPSSASQYEIKTLASDAETLKASGGMETSPKTFTPAPISGEELFVPTAVSTTVVKKKGSNKIILIIGAIVVVIALAVAGFVFVVPLLRTPLQTPDIPVDPPVVPVSPPVIQDTPDEISPLPTHTSFFTTPVDSTERLNIETVALESLKALFLAPEGPTLADGAIRELVVFTAGAPLNFSSFLSTMLPDILPGNIETVFEENFTLFVHKDRANNLPGFIAKVKTDTPLEALAVISTALEASPNIGNFYATPPGARSAFKAGGFDGNPTRFATFATTGYIFNYGWFKDAAGATYLVAASSYKGIIAAVARAGF